MGATTGYCRPVEPTDGRIASWDVHNNRGIPSVEAGTDYYTPRFTPVKAASSGRVVDVGDSIGPATGRFVTIDLDDGRRVRYLHLESRSVNVGDRVQWGQVIGKSGATGYGEADWSWNVAGTGGAHVHMTVWAGHYYSFGFKTTIDPEPLMKETDMPLDADDLRKIRAIVKAESGPGAIWNDHKFKARLPKAAYGFPAESAGMRLRRVTERAGRSLVVDRQNRAELAALTAAVEALAKTNGADPKAILKAVQDGVSKAMDGLKLTIDAD